MTQHALFSPSKMALVSKCPYALVVKDTKPAGKAAKIGTQYHLMLEQAVELYKGFNIQPNADDLPVQVVTAFNAVKTYVNKANEVYTEKRVYFDSLFGIATPEQCFGTVDLLMREGDHLMIFDYKFGRNAVEVNDNVQLMTYAYGALSEFDDVSVVTIGIVQPYVSNKVQTKEYNAEELRATLLREVKPHTFVHFLTDGDTKKLPRIAGRHCYDKYCPARAYCKECSEYIDGTAT